MKDVNNETEKSPIATTVALVHRGNFVMTPNVKETLGEELTRIA